MQASRFNKTVDLENGSKLLFNATTGAIAELPPDMYSPIRRLIESPDSAQTAEDKEQVDHLHYGGFLVEKEPGELTQLKVEYGDQRFGGSIFTLGIVPTLECNLACSYCAGRKNPGRMTRHVEKALLQWAARYIRKADETRITWYGGEPLLCVDTIERIQQGFAEMASGYKATLAGSTILTNGYLLSGDMARRLKSAGVMSAQVTLDGSLEKHDSCRPDSDGKPTFDRIIDNICEAAKDLDVVVRVNVHDGDMTTAREAVEMLDQKDILSKVGFYFGEATGGCEVCSDVTGRCRLSESHAQAQLAIYRALASNTNCRMDFPYLTPGSRCGSTRSNSFQVAPSGYLFKCQHQVSPRVDSSVGSIFSDQVEDFQQSNQWVFARHDPLGSSKCLECDILPVCMGGCPREAKKEHNEIQYKCSPLKDIMGELLVLRYLYEVGEEVTS